MIKLTTMTVQLIDNEADGVRICRVEGESLVTVVVPREKLAEARSLPQLPKRGVYFLLDEDHGILSRVYAGQTIQGLERLDSHKTKKDFWNKAIMFLDEDWNIDRDVLDALEAKAIDYVRNHGSYETDNLAAPNPRLSPYKEQRVEDLLVSVLFRMEALGYDLNRIDTVAGVVPALFCTKKNGVHARGRFNKDTGHFTVLAGSDVDLSRPVHKNQGIIAARKQLFGDAEGAVVLEDDLELPTPSAAAVFVLGGSQNGWIEWVNDAGETLNQVYRNKGE